MQLTIIRLKKLSPQDHADLSKIWPLQALPRPDKTLNEELKLYAARFNDRLLAALQLETTGTQGRISHLKVREVTQRRGIGRYLLEEVIAQNSTITLWQVAIDAGSDPRAIAAFMQSCGFRAEMGAWIKHAGAVD